MGRHTAVAPAVERLAGGEERLLRGVWQFVGGAGHRLHCAMAAAVCSRRGDGQTRRVVGQSGVVEGLVERCRSAEGVHWGWSRARWADDGGNGSCFCLCCYWASRAVYVPRAWRASGASGALGVAATVATAALARVSHCGNGTFSGAPQPAALLCRLPCCATSAHLRS